MNMNFLATSIGNTRTRIGVFCDGKLSETLVASNSDADQIGRQLEEGYGLLGDRPDRSVLIAAVDPDVEQEVSSLVTERLDVPVNRVERDMKIPIGRQLDREAIIGVDRLLNAAAAYDVLKQTCVIVDAGTALTVDLVDGSGTFHGGAIAPGGQMMLDSLHRGTALLPQMRLAKPDEPIGHNTAQAMLVAAYYGVRGIVRELVEQYAEAVGVYPVVVATGGDAELFFSDYEMVERIVPDLTLQGMAVTLRSAMHADS